VSNRRSHLVLIGFIVAALVAALLLALPGTPVHKKPTLGLDLQGGLEVVLKAVPPKGHKLTNDDLIRSRDIMADRINKLGVSEPDVRTQPPDQIVIQLAGVHDPAKAAALIGQTAQLQFFDLEADVAGPSKGLQGQVVATPTLYELLKQVQDKATGKNAGPFYLFRAKTVGSGKKATTKHSVIGGPAPTKKELLRPFRGEQPPGTEILAVPPGMQAVSCPVANGCPGITQQTASSPTYWYLFNYHPNNPEGPPELTGKDLKLSGTRADTDPQKGPIVDLAFTGHGSKMFQKITKAEYDRGKEAASRAGQAANNDPNVVAQYAAHNAIVLDGQIRSTPYIDYTDSTLSDGISGAAIIDVQSFGEAKDLALVLQTGALPVDFQQIERTDVSATLGKSSLHEAWVAALMGLALVAIFLLVVYRFLGLVAVVGLGIYAVLFYAAILLIPGVVLTLPGFAGLVLTIGVAADANVVIFERIKEEVRAGKSVRAAIAAGYGKGFHTIIDANVVTGITALVLFAVATAQVKGFAAFLLIGTIISLLTAVAATRAMLGLLAGFKWFGNARFMGASGEQKGRWLQIDFMGKRKLWFAISAVIIAIGMIALGVKGLNLGIDFKGGTQMSFRTASAQTTGAVQSVFAKDGFPDAVVQGRGSQGGNRYSQFQVRTKHLTNAQQARIVEDLRADAALKGQPDVNTVSSSFGRQIAHDAILAVVVSLLLIVIYIAIRFDFKFAVPVIVAMLHDILITIGVYALVGREVSTASVAAVLTVLGYSIYDTIIIFDRIRENVPLMRRAPFATIANVSLWETIRRSLATTFITLLPVLSLMVLGGQTLKDFAFALLVGIASGAYSSIFIAAPLLTMWKEREPEYARRKARPDEGLAEADRGKPARRRPVPVGAPATDGGMVALQESEAALASEPIPPLLDITPEPAGAGAQARREKRRQRRRTRPHGRAR
jgi:SecD/SecF fusion protein